MKITTTFNINRETANAIVESRKLETFELKVTTAIALLQITICTTVIRIMYLKVLLFSNVEID